MDNRSSVNAIDSIVGIIDNYANSYRVMANDGDGKVLASSVHTDLLWYIKPAIRVALTRFLAAQPPAAPVETAHMTYNTIKAAFDEFRKTVTVVEEKPSFNSFSQGYVAGWNAKEAVQCSSADNIRDVLELCRSEIVMHNSEYHHLSPQSVYDIIDAAIRSLDEPKT